MPLADEAHPDPGTGRQRTTLQTLLLLIILIGAGCAVPGQQPSDSTLKLDLPPVRLQPVVTRLPEITSIAHANDGSGRLFLATQRGQVLEIRDGALMHAPLLDLGAAVRCCGEQGLLGLAFDPHFSRNRLFYVSYIDQEGASLIARYRAAEPGQPVAAESGETVLRVMQPTPIHNGGAIAFGPDQRLYIALGDGGHFGTNADNSGDDPRHHAQSLTTLLGKILRIDVGAGLPYRVPDDNPFVGIAQARPEIWAYGLRNPWRMSFDRKSGDLFIADVGPSHWEEINWIPRGISGNNFGWSDLLGPDCFSIFPCDAKTYTPPILIYDHRSGCAVIGGYRYRGAAIKALRGIYLFGDFCTGAVWGGRQQTDGRWTQQHLLSSKLHISTFGEDEAGEIYLVDYSTEEGALYKLVADAPSPN